MKQNYLLLLFCTIFSLFSCNKENDDPGQKTATPRTVLMYLIGDNSLSDDMYNNIADIEEGLEAASLPEGNIVVYYDGYKSIDNVSTPILLKYTIDANGKATTDGEIIKNYSEQNSCDPTVMTGIIKDVAQLAPASSYSIIFGSHGGGWLPTNFSTKTRWFGEDKSSSENTRMEIADMATAIVNSGVHFDYLLMDACLMSQVEVAYELRNTADYLILSPTEVMAYGFPYTELVSDLLATGDKEGNAISIGKKYVNFYRENSSTATIGIIKSSEMENLANATRDMVSQYRSNLSIFTTSKLDQMQYSCNYARSSMANSSYDFRSFASILTGGNIPSTFQSALSKAVVYSDYVYNGQISGINIDAANFCGIGCYIPYPGYTSWNNYYASMGWNQVVKIVE